jgi:hypothetical protein
MSKYYYLIAGLPEIQPDDAKLSLHLQEMKETLRETLSKNDKALIDIIFEQYEAKNWLAFLRKSDIPFHVLGSSTPERFEEAVALLRETENPKIKNIPSYFAPFAYALWDDQPLYEGLSWDDQLMSLYYRHAVNCKNKFVSRWFEFCLNINNLLSAHICRKHGFDVQSSVVGENDVANILRTSNSRDFGVSDYFEHADQVLRVADEADLLERERKIDLLKWQWIEEQTTFEYFSIEVIAAYLMKLEIIERWLPLKKENGTEVFRSLIQTLKSGVKLSEQAV